MHFGPKITKTTTLLMF